jgi:class 3 adenylate cyclase
MPLGLPEPIPLNIAWNKVKGVVMFADLGSFFPVASKKSLDELTALLEKFYSLCATEIRRQRGEVISFVGDGMLAFFRPEKTNGMDPEWCATRAGFHLVKGLKKVGLDFEVNIGIHSGEINEGRWDLDGRPQSTVIGNVVNRAAILAGGKLKGIHVTKPIFHVLGPRVSHEKATVRFPGTTEDEVIFRLSSLIL